MKSKKLIYFILLILSSNLSFSQGWFEDNPKWTNNILGSTIIDGIQTLTVIGDTTINGQDCKILNTNRNYKKVVGGGDTISYDFNSYRFAYEEEDKVYFYDSYYEVFQLSYDFSLDEGDDMIFIPDGINCEPDTLKVYENGIITIDGVDLRYQKLLFHQEGDILELKNIIEKVGYYQDEIIDANNISSTSYPFPYLNMHYHFDCLFEEPAPNPICFQNDNFDFNYTNVSCDEITNISTIERNNIANIKFYPNPFVDEIQIENLTSYTIKEYELFDLLGNIIVRKQIESLANEIISINIPNITKGVYFVKVLLSNGNYLTSRMIN